MTKSANLLVDFHFAIKARRPARSMGVMSGDPHTLGGAWGPAARPSRQPAAASQTSRAERTCGSAWAQAVCSPVLLQKRSGPQSEAGRRAQVCDLGLARTDELWSDSSHSAASNPRWVAPEVLTGDAHSTASDVYAFGIVMCAPPAGGACTPSCSPAPGLAASPSSARARARFLARAAPAALRKAGPGRAARGGACGAGA
jgi:serine/threonine protein kinase